ncbi:MAG: hypothetical protein ACE5EN_05285 [Nitrospinota bacterium]
MYGKKQSDFAYLFAGIALMSYPYVVGSAVSMGLIGLALIGAPFFARRFL